MKDKYHTIKSRLLEFAKKDDNVKAIVAIGSSTRKDVKADEFSDLDLIIATEDVDGWLYGKNPDALGNVRISFVEPTIGGGKERRCIYEDSLDVDMIVFTIEQFRNAIKEGVAGWVCNRGYQVLYDKLDFRSMLDENIIMEVRDIDLSEEEFINKVNDFYFHIIWASKKILRGELWTAKMCIDAYLKKHLLNIIEVYSACAYRVDVWHDGRFLDRWADDETREELKGCFAHYDREDMICALKATLRLFTRLSVGVAGMKGYTFPEEAKKCGMAYVNEHLSRL